MKVRYYKKTVIEEYFTHGEKKGQPFLSNVSHIILSITPCCKGLTNKFVNEAWLLGDDFLLYPKPVGDEWEIVTPKRQLYCSRCGTKIELHKIFDIVIDKVLLMGDDWKAIFAKIAEADPMKR